MSIDKQTIQRIAKLARLKLSDAEQEHMVGELNSILQWVDKLQGIPTEDLPQMFGHSGMTLPLRDDVVTDGGIQEAVVANAPMAEYGCFVVPKVIE